MKRYIASLFFVLSLSACGQQVAGEASNTVMREGKIKVLNEKRLLIQETSSVVALDFDGGTGKQLSERYRAGQNIKLVGIKTIDAQGNSSETIKAIIFEDGTRFNISG
ncbi:MAG: hypothetical protein AB7L92_02610 [Alphaproteobacteria bacterium]